MNDELSNLAVPRWLTRAEKAAFRRIEAIRRAAGRPLVDAEVDLVCDYVAARSRLGDLRKLYRYARLEFRESPEATPIQNSFLAAARAIDTASASARRLGRQIGLGPQS